MAVTHLLDTSVFSQPVRDRPAPGVMERWSALGDEAVCTSALCVAEILHGLEACRSGKYWRRYSELLENQYSVLPFDSAVAGTFGKIAAELRRRDNPKPVVDLLIAATARHHRLIVVTLNVRDFTGIPGVGVEDWSV